MYFECDWISRNSPTWRARISRAFFQRGTSHALGQCSTREHDLHLGTFFRTQLPFFFVQDTLFRTTHVQLCQYTYFRTFISGQSCQWLHCNAHVWHSPARPRTPKGSSAACKMQSLRVGDLTRQKCGGGWDWRQAQHHGRGGQLCTWSAAPLPKDSAICLMSRGLPAAVHFPTRLSPDKFAKVGG